MAPSREKHSQIRVCDVNIAKYWYKVMYSSVYSDTMGEREGKRKVFRGEKEIIREREV